MKFRFSPPKHLANSRIKGDKLPLLKVEQDRFRSQLGKLNKENKALLDATIAQLEKEAIFYGNVIIDAYTRLGYAYYPVNASVATRGKAVKKPKLQQVRFANVLTQTERIWYKLEVNRHAFPVGTINLLPHGVRVADLVSDETRFELSTACERQVTFEHTEYEKGVWIIVNRLVGADGIPLLVHYNDVLEILSDAYDDDYFGCPVVVGIGEHRRPEILSFAKHPHWLIGGTSGGGKSNAINNFIATWLRFVSPEDLQLVLIDLKKVEFKLYRDVPHLRMPVVTNGIAAIKTLRELMKDVDQRNNLLSRNDEKEIGEWNRNHPDRKLPRIVVIIDELAELMLSEGSEVAKEASDLMVRISNLGRAAGINMIAATQLPSSKVIPMRVTGNMTAAIAVRTGDWRHSIPIIGDGSASKLPNIRGRVVYKNGANKSQLQTPLISLDNIKFAVRVSKGRGAGVIRTEGQYVMLDPEGMTIYIADHLEGRLGTKGLAKLGRELAVPPKQFVAYLQDLIGQTTVKARRREFEICPDGKSYRLVEIIVVTEPTPTDILLLPANVPVRDQYPGEAEPEVIERVTGPVISMTSDDVLDKFLSERCIVDKRSEVKVKIIYESYSAYCNELETLPTNKQRFTRAMHARNFKTIYRDNRIAYYAGIELKPDPVTLKV